MTWGAAVTAQRMIAHNAGTSRRGRVTVDLVTHGWVLAVSGGAACERVNIHPDAIWRAKV
jgi:hypothetical protein